MSVLELLLPKELATHFQENYWQRQALAGSQSVTNPDAIYDLDAWYMGTGFQEVFAVITGEHGAPASQRISPARMYQLYEQGTTICANVSQNRHTKGILSALAQRLGMSTENSFAKLYGSAKDGGGFPIHWDQHSTFVVQLSGAKRWFFEKSPGVVDPKGSGGLDADGVARYASTKIVDAPMKPDGTHARVPKRDALEIVELSVGDCLYLPPGTWHRGEAIGHSLAVSLSPVAVQ
jgi:ribosomal protein L16 Arg81 hydroxylase